MSAGALIILAAPQAQARFLEKEYSHPNLTSNWETSRRFAAMPPPCETTPRFANTARPRNVLPALAPQELQ